ncbi:ATP-binding protein [Streptomyces sp. NPDC054956]
MTSNRPNRPHIDWQALGLTAPPAHYPHPADYFGDDDGVARIKAHYKGELPASGLEPAERQWLHDEIAGEQRRLAEAGSKRFIETVPRRYAAVQPDVRTADWVRRVIANPETEPSLLLIGPTGTGKTHLAWGTLRAIAQSGSALACRWRAITAVDMYATLRPKGSPDPDAALASYSGAGLLFIDDLAAAKATEWTEEITYRIVNHRYEQCLPTMITSNVPPGQMKDLLGDRVASRLTEMCERVILRGDDLRKGRAA